MSVINKIIKIGKIAVSSAKETTKCKYFERNIRNIDKTIQVSNKEQIEHLKIRKENLRRKIKEEQKKESEKRKFVKLELKKQVKISKEQRQKDNKNINILERAQKEFKELPIVTAADDLVAGISDIDKIKEYVKNHPEDIYSWLNLAEALKFHKKTFLVVNGIKAPFDLIGTTLDIGMEFIGDRVENVLDKDNWTYERAVNQAKKLGATENQIEEFRKRYKINIVNAAVKGTGHMIYKQSKKMLNTSERILDFAVDKLMHKK
ncbi:hypothetical protein [Clostridium sp. DJ247]|uniref:hypothetical protein n=1 Tax=Clostridium sp. DJ247 TaxID=2726188 RepID=UPI001624D2BE|nr:hypothetical protein [Clostridium sp. DJ247]MBC2579046.1 hypothetical protein [Clostridium sp. DJ247]